MKKLLKKSLAVIMVVVMALAAAPLSGFVGLEFPSLATKAEAIEASDLPADFDLAKYNVKTIFSSEYGNGIPYSIFYDDISKYSCSKVSYNAFSQDADFVASVEAWEAIRLIANPSHLTEHLEYQQQYEEIIFAVLFSALKNEKYAEFSYSNMLTKVTSLTDNLLSTSRTAQLLDKTSLDGTEADEIKDIAFAFLTDGKDVESAWTAFGEYTDIVNKCNSIVDKSISTVVNAANIVTSTVMYVSMLEQGEQILTYLTDLKTKSPNSVFGAAVSTVINTLCQDWLGVVEKAIFDSGFVIGMEATEKLFDYAWSGCCAMCPFLGGMAIGEVVGTLVCNILFSTESLIEQFEYLKIVTQLETAACSLYQQYGNSCKSSVNSTNAAKLMFATDFSYALYNLGAEAAVEMMDIACNKGVVNKVANIFGVGREHSFDEFEESVEICVNSFEIGYSNMKNYWKFCIEEDYPEFFVEVSEDEVIAPKYIESINIEKDEVVFRVGDIMNFKRTISPVGYVGGIGVKSDNEAVFKSSEPMDILPIALEENIGTANITIYSINNPEICDTIKITVIGEDDEGTTEADSKYATGTCGDNLIWTLNKYTGRLTVTGSGAMYNYSSSSNVPWYSYRANIKSVTIGNSVTTIGDWAFFECDSLNSIIIPDSVITIGKRAFSCCDSLTSVAIGNGVITIFDSVFYNCKSLTSVTIGNSVTSIGEDTFGQCAGLETAYYTGDVAGWCRIEFDYYDSNPMCCADNIYIDGKLIEGELVIPDGVISIGNYAFYSCGSLKSITIPDGVTTIGFSAFSGCDSLTSVTIPNSVTTIGDYAFSGCDSLTSITIPDSVTTIGEDVFCNCNSLKSVTIGNNVTTIGENAFSWCFSLISIKIPDSVTTIGDWAFYDCTSLTSVTIGNSVTDIGFAAFDGCTSITNITIPDSVINIDGQAFNGCTNLKSVTLGNSVETISVSAFHGCTNLTSIAVNSNNKYYSNDDNGVLFNKEMTELVRYPIGNTNSIYKIPNSVTTIGDYAFRDCYSLTSVTIPDSVTTIGERAFSYCTNLKSVTIPDSVKSIGSLAFYECTSLESVIIGNSVETIGGSAFYGCNSLKNITIPDGVTTIYAQVFEYCHNLENVIIPDSVTTIYAQTFKDCDNLENVIIPDSVTTIGKSAFYSCSHLTSITIPRSVTTIGESAFQYCAFLKDVYYTGTEEQWNNISIKGYNERLLNATIHYNCSTHTHSYTSSVTTAVTCEKTGVITYRCSCGYSYIEAIPAKGHTPSEWETVLASTTEAEGKKIKKCTVCGETVGESIIPKIDEAVVPTPSQSTINYGDSIVLHVDAELIPENGYVEWTASNGNFAFSVSEDGSTCTITPTVSGETTFTATVYNEDGVPISTDEQVMTAKAGFFQKVIAFFKNLFGLSKIILQSTY